MDFSGKTIIITGASKGIGRATAIMAVARGAKVVATGRDRADLDSLVTEHGVRAITADFFDADETRRAAEASLPADYLVNCAGSNILESFLETKIESFEKVQALNVIAPLVISQIYARHRIAAGGGGSIVNVSSIASFNGIDRHASYSASKGALDGLTRVMALELGPHNIRVNSVNPGVTLTALAAVHWDDPANAAPLLARTPRGKFGTPEEVAEIILFLLSDAAAMVNGVALPVDGGLMAV
jgi:NAD(P)-dependent dehydrogenase (short-subunit alcohol dehydrogenase family)